MRRAPTRQIHSSPCRRIVEANPPEKRGNGMKRCRAYSKELSPEMGIKGVGGAFTHATPRPRPWTSQLLLRARLALSRFYHSRRVGQRLGHLWSPDQQAHKAAPSVVGLCPPPTAATTSADLSGKTRGGFNCITSCLCIPVSKIPGI